VTGHSSGANSNGAIIHYCAKPETCGTVTQSTLLLLDSGGQYVDGTTDVTRTVHLGTPTAYQEGVLHPRAPGACYDTRRTNLLCGAYNDTRGALAVCGACYDTRGTLAVCGAK